MCYVAKLDIVYINLESFFLDNEYRHCPFKSVKEASIHDISSGLEEGGPQKGDERSKISKNPQILRTSYMEAL